MIELDPASAPALIPHPLVIVTVGDPDNPGKRGGMTAAWVSRVSLKPPLVAVSVAPKRFTYQLIREFKAFAIHVVSKKHEKLAIEVFGRLSSRDVDKFAKAGIQPMRAQSVTAPIIPDVPLVLECRLVAEHVAGDHVLFIGEVVKAYKGSDDPPLVWYSSKCCGIETGY